MSIFARSQITNLGLTSLNRMIIANSKSGDLISARNLFDQMPERDVVSWNSIMTAYTHNHIFEEALRIFPDMHRLGFCNTTSFATALTCCAELRALGLGRQIHSLSIKVQTSMNVYVGTCLMTMYSKCNVVDGLHWAFDGIQCLNIAAWNALLSGLASNHRISDAREVFDRMPERNVVSWTAMIRGYVKVKKVRTAIGLFHSMPSKNPVTWSVMLGGLVSHGQPEEALDLFARMRYEAIPASGHSIASVLSACSCIKNLTHGRTVHGCVIKMGYHLDQIIEASLVFMYCECLSIEDAKLEFDKLESKFTGSVNSLIRGYIDSDRIDEARRLFDAMDPRDKISWNLMVTGYLESNRIDDALALFLDMPEPTMEAITSLMYGFIQDGRIEEAQKLFDRMPQRDVVAYTTLISGYLAAGRLDTAVELFDKMPSRNVVTYNVMISGFLHSGKVNNAYELFKKCPDKDCLSWASLILGFVQNGLNEQAILLFKEMLLTDAKPSAAIITGLLRSSSKLSVMILGEQLHSVTLKLAFDQKCLVISNSLINMYCKCGDVKTGRFIFDQMAAHRDVVTWNTMIYGYALHGLGEEAIELLDSMKKAMIRPDDVTFLGVLFACNHKCLLEEAQRLFMSMSDYGITPSVHHYACMVDLYCRVGMSEKAQQLASSMPFKPDSVVWTSLLSGCRWKGDVELAEYAADQLFAWDPVDRMPYLHLMKVYASGGKWGSVEKLRDQFVKRRSRKQPGCSWI